MRNEILIKDVYVNGDRNFNRPGEFEEYLRNIFKANQFSVSNIINYIHNSDWIKEKFYKNLFRTEYDNIDLRNKCMEKIENYLILNRDKIEEESMLDAYRIFEQHLRSDWAQQYNNSSFKVYIPTNGFYILRKSEKVLIDTLKEYRKNNR